MTIRPALSENPESDPGALADVAFRSEAAVAGWPMAPPVYPQLRKYPRVPATYVSCQQRKSGSVTLEALLCGDHR